jgi:hypothetical protein
MAEEKSAFQGLVIGCCVIAALAIGTGLVFYVHALTIVDTKVFGVADQNAQTDVYRHSEAYREGLQRDFDNLLVEYAKAGADEKPVILSTLRHRAEGAPPELIPPGVRALIEGGP